MKLRLVLAGLLFAATAVAQPVVMEQDTLSSLQETIKINRDGSLDVMLFVVPLPGKVLDLPVGYDSIVAPEILSGGYRFPVDMNEESQPVIRKRGRAFVRLIPTSTTQDSIAVVAFRVPEYFDWKKSHKAYGVVRFSKEFLNTSDYFIQNYSMEFLLPEGYLLHEVVATEPGFNPQKQPVPPYQIEKLDGHYRASLSATSMDAASRAFMDIELLKARRSMLPLVLGTILSLLYLFFYRDVLKKERD